VGGVIEIETGRNPMLKIVSAAAAAALLAFTPAIAADLPQDHKAPVSAPDEHAKAAQPAEQQTADDDDIQVVIMGQGMHVQVPNPFKNPRPRMLTDAWAMRA
jgi:hypothetical protein